MIFMRATRPSWTHLGEVHDLLQQTVEAMANEHPLLHRFDVHVARAAGDRAVHDQVHEIDDGGRVAGVAWTRQRRCRLLEYVVVGTPHQRPGGAGILAAAARAARGLARRRDEAGVPSACDLGERLVRVPVLDRFEDVGARRDDLLDAITGLELQVLHQAEQERVRHRHREQVLLESHGDAHAFERDFLGNEDDRGGVGRILTKARAWETELIRERLGDLLFGGEVQAHEDRPDAFAGPFVLSEGDLEIFLRDEPCLYEAFPDLLAHPYPSLRQSPSTDA